MSEPQTNIEDSLRKTLLAWEASGVAETWAPRESIRPDVIDPAPGDRDDSFSSLPALSLGVDEDNELRVLQTLGAGGMGKVELAYQRSLHREVAVKVLREERRVTQGEDGEGGKATNAAHRMLEEAYVTGRLSHPNIIPVYALGYNEAVGPLIVMKRVVGKGWHELLAAEQGPGDEHQASHQLTHQVERLLQVCNAVQFAHSRGILHLDVKPENVMLGDFGEVYLVDWGIALEVSKREEIPAGMTVGTPSYMAPEMTRGLHHVDERTDVFLLGATLHELLTGEPRYRGHSLGAVVSAAIRAEPATYADNVPQELATICNRACHLDPNERHQSALAFREDLQSYLRHRASHNLADAAKVRFSRVQELFSEGDNGAEIEEAPKQELRILAAECLFGLQQALREWPDNESALAGLQEILALMISFELSQTHLGSAQNLLAMLPTPRPDLQAQIEAMREKQVQEKQANAVLEQLKEDYSIQAVSYGTTALTAGFGVFWFVLCLGLSFLDKQGSIRITALGNLYVGGGLAALLFSMFYASKKTMPLNKLAHQYIHSQMVFVLAMLCNRAIGAVIGLPPTTTFTFDLLIGAVFIGVLGVLSSAVDLVVAGLFASAALVAACYPAHALELLGGMFLLHNLETAWTTRPRPASSPGVGDDAL